MTAPMPETMSPREKVELKPCPFCGSQPERHPSGDGTGTMIECIAPDCPNPHVSYYGDGEAEARWNRRAALASSGDHAELARWIDDYERDAAIDAEDDGDLSHVDDGLREFPMRGVKALIAEVAALRGERDRLAKELHDEVRACVIASKSDRLTR
ncbi:MULTISPECIES: Lar family restriction alleviation protein [unclassified Brevundimonas]|uniref:Lar family restriction alleviation protein n=1 Tax=unclassified Brevundimonas TaxID=2622653 RepID=UPI0025C62617|nr:MULTISPECIES: Lar family restriction alleviation protein [unclassified Brevundimonas]